MNMKKTVNNQDGFTLVELMIAVFLSAIAVIGIYRGYTSFSQAADAQEQIIELQQNLRIGMYRLEKDLRRAGMNEEEDETAGFVEAWTGYVLFTMDWTGGETDGKDNDNDGGADNLDPEGAMDESIYGDDDLDDTGERIKYYRTGTNLFREHWDGPSGTFVSNIVLTNVSALDFIYLDKDETFIAPGTDPDLLADIRSIQVSLVVETTNEDYRYTDNLPYENSVPQVILPAQGDHKRRRILTKQIKVRNAGL